MSMVAGFDKTAAESDHYRMDSPLSATYIRG